jgi:hypothetical protein
MPFMLPEGGSAVRYTIFENRIFQYYIIPGLDMSWIMVLVVDAWGLYFRCGSFRDCGDCDGIIGWDVYLVSEYSSPASATI